MSSEVNMTDTSPAALSAQELAIESGKKVVHGTVTDRVLRMYEAIRAYGPPRITLDRAVLFTESFKGTENQPLVMRWAKALKNFAEKAPVTIFTDELIVGRPNTWMGRWGIVYPELDGAIMPAGVEMFRKNKGKPGEVAVTDEDEKIINQVLTPYWTGKDYATNFIQSLPEETRFMMYGPDPKNLIMMTVVVMATSPMRHSQNWTPDFSKILNRGVKGIREDAQAKLVALSEPREIVYKKPFLEAVIMTCDAMTIWSSAPGAVVGPDVQPHRADLERHGPGEVGPVSLAALPEGLGRGPDHQGVCNRAFAVRLAADGAVRGAQT
jgi:hypothetical protein